MLKDGIRVLEDAAVENYVRFFGIEPGCATFAHVENSSSGVAGWATYEGPGIKYIVPPMTLSRPRKEIEEETEEDGKQEARPTTLCPRRVKRSSRG